MLPIGPLMAARLKAMNEKILADMKRKEEEKKKAEAKKAKKS